MVIKGSLEYASWKYHLIFGGVVVGINCGWGHTPSVHREKNTQNPDDLTEHRCRQNANGTMKCAHESGNSLISVGSFSELVGRHPGREVVVVHDILKIEV